MVKLLYILFILLYIIYFILFLFYYILLYRCCNGEVIIWVVMLRWGSNHVPSRNLDTDRRSPTANIGLQGPVNEVPTVLVAARCYLERCTALLQH
jgi:hypothetical protein